jgi:MFS family permease
MNPANGKEDLDDRDVQEVPMSPDDDINDPENEINVYNLVFLAFVANLGTFLYGFDYAAVSWTLTIIDRYGGDDDQFSYFQTILDNDALQGVLASGCSIGAAITYVFLLIYGNEISKRDEIILTASLYFVGAFLASTSGMLDWSDSTGYCVLMAGLIVYGSGIACSFHSVPQYVALFAPAKYRGIAGAATESLGCTGLGTAYIVGFFFDVNAGWIIIFRVAYIVAAVMFVLAILFLPHAPRFLIENDHPDEEVLQSLRFIYPNAGMRRLGELQAAFDQELKDRKRWEKKTHTELSPKELCHPSTLFNSLPSRVRVMLADKGLLQCLVLALMLIVFEMLIGPSPVLYYSGFIFDKICPSNPNICILGLGMCKVFGAYSMLIFGDSLGRREFLLTGVAILIGGDAVAAYGIKLGRQTFAICGIYFFQVGFEISLGTIMWIFLSELFPRYVRSAATSLVVMNLFIWNSIVSFIFPYLVTGVELYGAFLCFLVSGVILWNIIYFYVPETRGVDLEVSYKLVKLKCNQTNYALGVIDKALLDEEEPPTPDFSSVVSGDSGKPSLETDDLLNPKHNL